MRQAASNRQLRASTRPHHRSSRLLHVHLLANPVYHLQSKNNENKRKKQKKDRKFWASAINPLVSQPHNGTAGLPRLCVFEEQGDDSVALIYTSFATTLANDYSIVWHENRERVPIVYGIDHA